MDLIKNLIDNYPKHKKKINLDIILESGAANGSYHLGCLLYIRGLELKKKLKIYRISGSSIGAVAGFYYLTNSLHVLLEDYKILRKCFKEKYNFSILQEILKKKINLLTPEEIQNLNNRLFIVYYDVQQKKQILKQTYDTKQELLNTLLKSCHLPYISDDTMFYTENNKKYFDGGVPYIFSEREYGEKKLLYVNISTLDKIKNIFSIKKEKNNYGRLLEGALDAHEFFLFERPGKFCSYVNNWKMNDYIYIRLKQLIFKLFFYLFIMFNFINIKITPLISDFYFFQMISPIFINFYRDLLLYYCI